MANIAYTLKPAYVGSYSGGTIRVDDTRSFDVGAALTAGGGTISVADTDAALVSALDAYLPLQRSGTSASPPVVTTRREPLLVKRDEPAVAGQVPVLQADGTWLASAGSGGASSVALVRERERRRALLREALDPGIASGQNQVASIVFAGPTVATPNGVYYAPQGGMFRLGGGHIVPFTDNAATTWAGESFVSGDNVRGGLLPGVFFAEFLTDSLNPWINYTGGPTFRIWVDGKLMQSPVAATFTATTNSAATTNVLTAVSSTTGLVVGQAISGPGIPPYTTITAIDTPGSTVTMSQGAVISASGVTVTAYAMLGPINQGYLHDSGGTTSSPPATTIRTSTMSGNQSRQLRLSFPGNTVRVGNNSGMGGNEAGRLRRIRVEWTNGAFGGVYIGGQDAIEPVRANPGGALIVLGDSHTAGTGAGTSLDGWVQKLGHLLGREVHQSGIGGTGYINPGTSVTLINRLATDAHYASAANGDEILIAMGANDNPASGDIQGAAAAVYADLAASCPGVPVHVLGPITSGDASLNTNWAGAQTQIAAAAAAAPNVVSYTNPAGWVKGTGNLTSRQTNGWADHYVVAGGVHFTQVGHDGLGRWVAEKLAAVVA